LCLLLFCRLFIFLCTIILFIFLCTIIPVEIEYVIVYC
jgi:hypothetical protein